LTTILTLVTTIIIETLHEDSKGMIVLLGAGKW
jgi:hypothetical protein